MIFTLLQINAATILNASPYFQQKTNRHEACQIDLLIQTAGALYICEIKCKKNIDMSVVHEVREKIPKLKLPQNVSVRTVLIYEGSLSKSVLSEQYFR